MKLTRRRLTLKRETLRQLSRSELSQGVGGYRPWLSAWTCNSCPDASCGCANYAPAGNDWGGNWGNDWGNGWGGDWGW